MVVNWTRQRTLGVNIEIFGNDSVAWYRRRRATRERTIF
jgi:hypothetical protein